MKYLITGGCGFLGTNIAKRLIDENEDVYLFDNLSRAGSHENLDWLLSQGKVSFIKGCIKDKKAIEEFIKDISPDVIFHLAGQVAMTSSIENPRNDFEVNALGSFNILDAVRLFSPKSSVIYSSTNKVYGDLNQYTYTEHAKRYSCNEKPDGFDELTPLEFHSPYGASKGSADQYMIDFSRIYGIKTVVFRHSSMFGGRQFATSDQGWVGWFVSQALMQSKGKNENFTISGNGKQVRDLLHADDCVELYIQSSKNMDTLSGEVFNIGGGFKNSCSILELFEYLEDILKIDLNYNILPERESDQKVFIADLQKINKKIGWSPKITKKEGIHKMIEWVKEMQLNL